MVSKGQLDNDMEAKVAHLEWKSFGEDVCVCVCVCVCVEG